MPHEILYDDKKGNPCSYYISDKDYKFAKEVASYKAKQHEKDMLISIENVGETLFNRYFRSFDNFKRMGIRDIKTRYNLLTHSENLSTLQQESLLNLVGLKYGVKSEHVEDLFELDQISRDIGQMIYNNPHLPKAQVIPFQQRKPNLENKIDEEKLIA